MKNDILLNLLHTAILEKRAVWNSARAKAMAPQVDAQAYAEGMEKGHPPVDKYGNKLGTKNYISPENEYIENFYNTFNQIANNQNVEDGGAYAQFVLDPAAFKGLAARMSNGTASDYDKYLVEKGMQSVYDGTPEDSKLGAQSYDSAKFVSMPDGTVRRVVSNVPLSSLMNGGSTVNTAAGFNERLKGMQQDVAATNQDNAVYTSRQKLPNNVTAYDVNMEQALSMQRHNQEVARKQMSRDRTWNEYLFNRDSLFSPGQKYNPGEGAYESKGWSAWNPFSSEFGPWSSGAELKYEDPALYSAEQWEAKKKEKAREDYKKRNGTYLFGQHIWGPTERYKRRVTSNPDTNTLYNNFRDQLHDWWNQ